MSSPRQNITAPPKHGKIRVPEKQQKLLDRDDCWAVDLKINQNGTLHFPGDLLEQVKKTYLAQQATEIITTKVNPEASAPNSSPPPTLGSPPRRVNREIDRQANEDPPQSISVPSSSPGTELSWPSSPVRNMDSPPRTTRKMPRADVTSGLLDEDSDEDEELETEVPQPFQARDKSINRTAKRLQHSPMSTPPCAQPTQPTIPNTIIERPTRPTAVARAYRFKAINMDNLGVVESGRDDEKDLSFPERMPKSKVIEFKGSNSTDGATIPMTCEEGPARTIDLTEINDDDRSVVEVEERSSAMDMEIEIQDEARGSPQDQSSARFTAMEVEVETQREVGGFPCGQRPAVPPEKEAEVADRQPIQHVQRGFESITPIPLHSISPYETFTQVYPDYVDIYSGSLWDFVKACLCLDWLQKRRMLRDCLFDDFIRTFPDYQTYIRNSARTPLPALEWYNNQPGQVLFDRMAVTRDNLSFVLDFYPRELANAKRMLLNNQGDDALTQAVSPPPLKRAQAVRPAQPQTKAKAVMKDASKPSVPPSQPKLHGRPVQSAQSAQSAQPNQAGLKNHQSVRPAQSLPPNQPLLGGQPRAGNQLDRSDHPVLPDEPKLNDQPDHHDQSLLLNQPESSSQSSSNDQLSLDDRGNLENQDNTNSNPSAASGEAESSPKRPTQAKLPITQLPPPPSPELPELSSLIGTQQPKSTPSMPRKIAPRSSRYLSRLSGITKSTPHRRTPAEIARLQEHLRKKKAAGSPNLSSRELSSRGL